MTIVYDCDLRRPGCPLLQAVLGGTPGLSHRFPAESWILHPTPGLKTYNVTEEQLEFLAQGFTKVRHSAEKRAV